MIWKIVWASLSLTLGIAASELSVLERYTTLRTIAGLGDQEDRNFWQAQFEGANPRLTELSNPHDCGTDALGRVYIVDKQSHSVLRVSADGSELITVAGTHSSGNAADGSLSAVNGALSNPNGLYVFADGSFLILDTDNRKVRQVDRDGMMETLFTYPAGFGAGRGLVASVAGDEIYFCGEFVSGSQQNVKRWTEAEGFSTVAGINSGTRGLGNLDVGPDGSLFVTSAGDHRVFQIKPGQTPVIVAGNGTTNGNMTSGSLATTVSLDRVRGIAVLPDGSFFVATQKGGDVWWVDNGPANNGINRRIHLFVNGAGSGNIKAGDNQPRTGIPDRIAEPRAIHLATNGDLLITCNDTGVIRAVRNICKATAPVLSFNYPFLAWQADWREQFVMEVSHHLEEGSWSIYKSITSLSGGLESLPLPDPVPRFMRFVASQQAGGQ
ncbi:MAG: hypothetical protein ACI9NQ_000725 [Paracoccaceae bacterium]|jgi:hypothetical protein